ncbi:hypothetical protein Pmani_001442 [Petrolisthes manimaculis]|uniref:Uncharacterized protein n=1 Tax=Petrolisthes manimaculis TaxID=1843537 RepID=A0AAE1QKK1_9EUCA|nr:hypothetical protein Pmani_001442 [Petrolisthes manimaculis]
MKRELAQHFTMSMETPTDMMPTEYRMQFLEGSIDKAFTSITPMLCLKTCNHVQTIFPGVMQMKDLDMGDTK